MAISIVNFVGWEHELPRGLLHRVQWNFFPRSKEGRHFSAAFLCELRSTLRSRDCAIRTFALSYANTGLGIESLFRRELSAIVAGEDAVVT